MAIPIIGSDEVAIFEEDLERVFKKATGHSGRPEFVDRLDAIPPETYQIYMDRRLLNRFMEFPFDSRLAKHVKADGPVTQRDIMLAILERTLREQDAHLTYFPRSGQRELALMYHLAKRLPNDAKEPEQATYYSRAILNLVGKVVNNNALSQGNEANTRLLETYVDMVRSMHKPSDAWTLYIAMLERALRNGFDFLDNDSRRTARYILGEGLEEREWPGIVQRATEVLHPVLSQPTEDLQHQVGKVPYSMLSGDSDYVLRVRKNAGTSLLVPESDVPDLLRLGAVPEELAAALASKYGFDREDVLRLMLREQQRHADVSIEYTASTEPERFAGFEAWHAGEPITGPEGIDIFETVCRAGRIISGLAQKRRYEPERTRYAKPTLYIAFDPSLNWEPWSEHGKDLYDVYAGVAAKLGNDALSRECPVYVNGVLVQNRDQLELAVVRRAGQPTNSKAIAEAMHRYETPLVVVMASDICDYRKLQGEGAVAIFYPPRIDHYDSKGRPVSHYTERRAVRQLDGNGVACVPLVGFEDARGVSLRVSTK